MTSRDDILKNDGPEIVIDFETPKKVDVAGKPDLEFLFMSATEREGLQRANSAMISVQPYSGGSYANIQGITSIHGITGARAYHY